jgi:hypothetical protein
MLRTALRVPFWAGTTALTAAGLLLIASIGRTQVAPPPPGPPTPEAGTDEPGIETLTQGPIHEAFANPTEMDPTPGPVVPKEPPQPIAEDPPEFMPEGAVWISGYWVWDDDRDEFIWVTGVARVPPPNMQWVPGYFADADGGWQRVSGFWASAEEPEVEYRLTGPPETLEAGPSSPAPSETHFWVPGNWAYYDTGYRWHGGYWAPYVENWIWVPARWVWTPGGYVFCPGHWDHRLAYRGQMFAPIYFQEPIYLRPRFVYRPWCVIPSNNLFIHLWIRPRWNCYYFGNYYGAQFAQRGFVPWANLTVGSRQRYYDPFFTYAHVHYRQQGVDYIGRVQGWHRHFAQHEDLRPPRTWREQQRTFGRDGQPRVETQLVARTVVDVARRQDTAVRMVRLDDQSIRTQRQHSDRLREFNQQRRELEVAARQTTARPDGDRRGDDRDRPGKGDGKAGSLVDRAEGKAGRDDKGGGGRGGAAPRLTIPRDLAASTPTIGRERGADDRDDNRGKAGKVAGGQKTTPPPRPRPTSTAGRDDKGGKDDREPKGVTKAADRQETPPSVDGRDRGKGKLADRDETPGRGKTGDARATARDALPGTGRDPTGIIADPDRGSKAARDPAGRPGTPDFDPTPGRGKAADRDDDKRGPGAGKSKAGGQPDRDIRTPNLPGVGDTPRRGDTPGADLPGRNVPGTRRDDDSPGRGTGKTVGPRPDAGVGRPSGTITPGTVNPDRLGAPGTTTPGANRGNVPGADRGPPGGDRGGPGARTDAPRVNPPATSPGRGSDTPRSSPLVPRGNAPTARPDNQPDNRGKGNNPSRGKSDPSPNRTESFRPTLNREAPPAAMPRVEPRPESRPMPRVEPPRESRPMPRAEAPRENRPSPRIETPRPSARSESSRPGPSADRGSRDSSGNRPDSGSSSGSSDRPGSKGKGRDRDN